ncbi:MAG: hypothetical protein WBM07_17080 [Chitinivibrionales bacterium]
MFQIVIKQGFNGWYLIVDFENFTNTPVVFNDKKDLLVFLERALPEMSNGYISFLKEIIAERDNGK